MNLAISICFGRLRWAALLFLFANVASAQQPPAPTSPELQQIRLPATYPPAYSVQSTRSAGSTYIPMDSWIYPALWRLYALGYLDTAYLGMRPWTRLSVLHMLGGIRENIADFGGGTSDEAAPIFLALVRELGPDAEASGVHAELDTVYSRFLGITDTPLNDSWHLGQTIINDYGRPYQAGINNSSGVSGRAEYGRFTLYARGEYQRAPSAAGYSMALGDYLSQSVDLIPIATNPVQATLPIGPLSVINYARVMEAQASVHLAGHEVSFGKGDRWWGPALGGAFAWSNNADNIYAFEINRVEPLHIPLFSDIFGSVRYDFSIGTLQGHTSPNAPWVHAEKISFRPTPNFEFGIERNVLWGGKGHEPITLHTFLKSFFSFQNVTIAEKFSRNDPGARYSAFDFTYRLPFVRDWLTLYTDSLAHDDVLPISAPRRAGIHPGIYLSHVPSLPHLDVRVEAASTDPPTGRSVGGDFLDGEDVELQGTTNKGRLFGDAIGRENKGGQAWLTYHLSPAENVQFSYRGVKGAKDFIAGGTTQNQYCGEIVKRLGPDIELKASLQYEQWKAPIYRSGANSDVSVIGQLTWYPHKTREFGR